MNNARIRRYSAAVIVFSLMAVLLAAALPVQASTSPITTNLRMVVLAAEPIPGTGYVEVQAAMSADVTREDGSQGNYKVPVTLLYPETGTVCQGLGLVDVLNSVFYETYESVGTDPNPPIPTLFPLARWTLGDAFIQSRGFVYAQAQWNKLVIERHRDAGTLTDPTLHIDAGTDGYIILRDLSAFLRAPDSYFDVSDVFAPNPCAVQDVIGFGYSQTAMLLRQFTFTELNTQLATSIAFDDGLVFEGTLQVGPGSHCRSLTDVSPWYSYSYNGCTGATPKSQGKVITVNTETDVQIINGWKARPKGLGSQDRYRLYELAGTSHIPSPLFPLKVLNIRPDDMADQNYADTSPVLRAMIDHLRDWIAGASEPPANVYLNGQVGTLSAPLFSDQSWGNDNQLVYVFQLGSDGNALGGVRLPHLRTKLPDGQEIGGPLGLYRGVECGNDPSDSQFILNCQLSGDPFIYNMAGGTFIPYQPDSEQCSSFYDSYETYVADVTHGALYAASQDWILDDEVSSLVAVAEQLAQDEYADCVPAMVP